MYITKTYTDANYFIIMSKKLKSTLKNFRTYNSIEIESDHSLVISNLVMKKPNKTKHIAKKQPKRYDTDKLQSKETSKKFSSIIGEGFSNILDEDDEITPYEFYIEFKKIVNIIAEKEIGHKRHNEIPGLSSEVKYLLNKIVKAEVQKQKNDNLSEKISEMEDNFKKNSDIDLYLL